ncbi:hypothetical protein PV336_15835 [Streptomyces sp. MI02-2A]|uniref:phage tail fiber protein n=1 Tax=Streptomyces sp. MI02-2A TaxID=3028688 RepID=UPI0029AECF14|nr:hypothetical protein [Streptomyces sp. MI02-2A]MDX3260690.1 hypothetical protein [Streptomyces sp. MI02-2A]
MAGTPSKWAANALDFLTGRAVAYTAPRSTYLALLIADPDDPTDLTSLAEVSTLGYARQQVVWTAPAGEPVTTQNNALLFFGPFLSDMTDAASHAALVTSASGTTGDVLFVWPLADALLAVTNESLQVAAGALTLNA